jgi:hypothetical protein
MAILQVVVQSMTRMKLCLSDIEGKVRSKSFWDISEKQHDLNFLAHAIIVHRTVREIP